MHPGDFAASLLSDSQTNSTTVYRAGSNFTAINFGSEAVQYSTSLTNETNFPTTVRITGGAAPAGWEDLAIVLPLCRSVCYIPTSTRSTTSTTNTTTSFSTVVANSSSFYSTSTTSTPGSTNSTNPGSPSFGSPQTILIESVVVVAAAGSSIAAVSVLRRKPT